MDKIPMSVLLLLKEKWDTHERDEGHYSGFEFVFDKLNRPDRRTNPSYVFIRSDEKKDGGVSVFSGDEAKTLVQDKVLGEFATIHENGIGVNEHAHHALVDFLSDVYRAWGLYQKRLDRIRAGE